MTVPTITLNDGRSIPQLGLGVFRVPADDTQRVVEQALEAGYRHIDTAAGYGNEAGVGAAVRASGLPRDEIWVTSKLDNGDHGRARQGLEESLEALGLDRVDLYLIHWPQPSKGRYVEVWEQFEKAQDEGLATSIGVSNFLEPHLDTLVGRTRVVPAVNQFELHPSFQQREVQERSRSLGIAVEAYAPLGKSQDLELDAIRETAAARGATPAQVVLAWQLAHGVIAIPKTTNPARMAENLAAASLGLTEREVERLDELDTPERLFPDPAVNG